MAAQTQRLQLVSPVGRFVSGDIVNKRTTDMDGRPIADPKKHAFHFGLAVRKDDPALPGTWQQITQFTAACYQANPDALRRLSMGLVGSKRGGLSLKIKDGDEPDAKGNRNPNTAGCMVFYMSTTLPIKVCNAANTEIDPTTFKRGYFGDVAMSIAPNGEVGERCGIYLNPGIVRMLAFGEEIHGGLTPEQAFGAAPAPTHLPQGASQTPLAPSGGIPGAVPGFTPSPSGSLPGFLPQSQPSGGALPTNILPGSMPGGLPAASPSLPAFGGSPSMTTIFPSNPAPVAAPPTFTQIAADVWQSSAGGYVNAQGQPVNYQPQPAPVAAPPTFTPVADGVWQSSAGGYVNAQGQPVNYQPAFTPGPQQPGNVGLPTGYPSNQPPPYGQQLPINPVTGLPVAPHPNFLNPPR